MKNGSKQTVLVVVAHTDDETLGMGGTIANHKKQGDSVYCLSMTDGISSRNDAKPSDIEMRLKASEKAAEELGFKWLPCPIFPDNALDTVPLLSIVKIIEEVKEELKPKIVYTHTKADLNIDHRIVSDSVLTAFRPGPNENWEEIITFEIPSATDYGHKDITGNFTPNLFRNIKNSWETKKRALEAYSVEMRDYPHSRSSEALLNLAKYTGNKVGLDMAEAFQLIRKVIR